MAAAAAIKRVDRQLDRHAFAELVGYRTAGTITKNLSRSRERRAAGQTQNLFPEPDGYLGRTPYWLQSTAEKWIRESKLGQGMAPGEAGDTASSGPGTCPVCGEHQPGSVATHRRRKAACSFNPEVRHAASLVDPDYDQAKVEQVGPGQCPCCGKTFRSVTSHRLQKMECSFNPRIRAALKASA